MLERQEKGKQECGNIEVIVVGNTKVTIHIASTTREMLLNNKLGHTQYNAVGCMKWCQRNR